MSAIWTWETQIELTDAGQEAIAEMVFVWAIYYRMPQQSTRQILMNNQRLPETYATREAAQQARAELLRWEWERGYMGRNYEVLEIPAQEVANR